MGSDPKCSITAGTYSERLMVESGGIDCPEVPELTLELDGRLPSVTNDASTPDDGVTECSTKADALPCSFITSCTASDHGGTVASFVSLTFASNSASGKQGTHVTDSTGATIAACTYDVIVEKK